MKPIKHPAYNFSPATRPQRSMVLGVGAAFLAALSLNGWTAWKVGAGLPWAITLVIAGTMAGFGIHQAFKAKGRFSKRQLMFRYFGFVVNGLVITLAAVIVGGVVSDL